MRIKIEKLFDEKDDSLRVIEELYIKLPKKLVEGLGWEDGDLVEFEILDTSDDEDNKDVVLRKIEDDVLDAELDSLREATNSKK
jgi:bifunctional DNA-binding transcriptional regulator/antitoxin component of YhaV-PrlF toxin-antitoxin module|tara:strand:- start:1273 stop:1524 length:252 start_codon:yes stop_codon:yes gene_type:complete